MMLVLTLTAVARICRPCLERNPISISRKRKEDKNRDIDVVLVVSLEPSNFLHKRPLCGVFPGGPVAKNLCS